MAKSEQQTRLSIAKCAVRVKTFVRQAKKAFFVCFTCSDPKLVVGYTTKNSSTNTNFSTLACGVMQTVSSAARLIAAEMKSKEIFCGRSKVKVNVEVSIVSSSMLFFFLLLCARLRFVQLSCRVPRNGLFACCEGEDESEIVGTSRKNESAK